ncbi:hypothetical protein [Nocardia sp. NPDC005998]|uniref:hypothetical protein n=1 Tax=Nocardia sp. NPDC005998 TaxID=3156894 RepID=UPI0033A41372
MDRRTRLFVFPGGLLELADYGDEDESSGIYPEWRGSEPPATGNADTDGPAA